MGDHRHRAYGLAIACAFPLPAADVDDAGGAADLVVSVDRTIDPAAYAFSGALDAAFPAVGRRDDGWLLHFAGHASFAVSRDARRVSVSSDEPRATVEQLLLDQVVPRLLRSHGLVGLHGSACVLAGGDAIAFVGPSGRGKSTLAASMAREAGGALIADDCVAIDRQGDVRVGPASHRLRADSLAHVVEEGVEARAVSPRMTWKSRVPAPRPSVDRAPLRRVYVLETADVDPTITPLRARDAVLALAHFFHRIDPRDRDALAAELDDLTGLARCVTVRRLAYRHRFDDLARVRTAIVGDLTRSR